MSLQENIIKLHVQNAAMSSSVLLINLEGKKSHQNFVPLSLLKLSTFYKRKGCEIEYIKSGFKATKTPNVICFSPVFLFNLKNDVGFILKYKKMYPSAKIRLGGISPSLRPDIFKKYIKDCDLHIGLCDEIENLKPDYEIAGVDFDYGFTSRGCKNKCAWCVVPKLEGGLTKNIYWKNYLSGKHRLFNAMDNNILANDFEWVKSVMDEIKKRNMLIDFNQAMDICEFERNEKMRNMLIEGRKNFSQFRFAWDGERQTESVKKMLPILKDVKGVKDSNIWYLLYGFKEPFEKVFYRMKLLLQNNQKIKLMRYKDIVTGKYNRIDFGTEKADELHKAFAINGIIASFNYAFFDCDYSLFEKILFVISKINKENRNFIIKKKYYDYVISEAKKISNEHIAAC